MQHAPWTGQPDAPSAARPAPPRLRVVRGGLDDAVLRRRKFESEHPEIVITPPGDSCLWTARRDGTTLATGYQLGALLDTLAWLLSTQP